jgi:hypothetical protein
MDFNHLPVVQHVKFNFSSEDLIHIRVTVNGVVKVVQCRSILNFIAPIDIHDHNLITIENLTNNIACKIDAVWLNYLNITPAVHEFTQTYTKADKNQIGAFVSDIFSPDICVMQFDIRLYKKLMPYFKQRII